MEIICKVWVDDIVIKGGTTRALLENVGVVVLHLREKSLRVAAHK